MGWLDFLTQLNQPHDVQPPAVQPEQGSGILDRLGSLYSNVYLGPEAQSMTPEQRLAMGIRGRLMALSAAARGENPTRAREGFQAAYVGRANSDQRQKAYGDYLDQQIAAATDPAEKQRLMIAKLTGTVPKAPEVKSKQVRSQTEYNNSGQQREVRYSGVDGSLIDATPWHAIPKRGAGGPKPGDEQKDATQRADWEWLKSLPPAARARYTSDLATGPFAQRARNAMTAFRGESAGQLMARLKELDAPTAAQPTQPGSSWNWSDFIPDALKGGGAGQPAPSPDTGPTNPDLDSLINDWKNGPPKSFPKSAPTTPAPPTKPLTMQEYIDLKNEHARKSEEESKRRRKNNRNIFGVDVAP